MEDASTIGLLENIAVAAGWHCLEIGGGGGSIARWLADRVGATGRVVATDTDTSLLQPSIYEVWRHDILHDGLPPSAFDLVHLRHVLIHIDQRQHLAVLRSLIATLGPGGRLLIEESDLLPWQALSTTPEHLRKVFAVGVDTTLTIYRSRNMDPELGANLNVLLTMAGFTLVDSTRRTRRVVGGSSEARFHQVSARQLANSVRASNAREAVLLDDFAGCLEDTRLEYETRATVSLSAIKATGL